MVTADEGATDPARILTPDGSQAIGSADERIADLESALQRATEEREALKAERDAARKERDALAVWSCVTCDARFSDTVEPAGVLEGDTQCPACVRADAAEVQLTAAQAELAHVKDMRNAAPSDGFMLTCLTADRDTLKQKLTAAQATIAEQKLRLDAYDTACPGCERTP